MITQILTFLKAWARGESAELNIDQTIHFSWFELVVICLVIGFSTQLFYG